MSGGRNGPPRWLRWCAYPVLVAGVTEAAIGAGSPREWVEELSLWSLLLFCALTLALTYHEIVCFEDERRRRELARLPEQIFPPGLLR